MSWQLSFTSLVRRLRKHDDRNYSARKTTVSALIGSAKTQPPISFQSQNIAAQFSQDHVNTYTVSQKYDTDVAHYKFDTDQPILIVLGRNVAETACYQKVICYPTCPD